MSEDNIIEFHHIKKSYVDNVIIPDLNLNVERGDFLTVIGSSGCGKTTMLKMINRLITPDSGEILIDSKNIEDMDLIKLRCSIGYSIQGTMLFPHLTVGENISYVPDLIEEDKKRDRKYRKGKKVEFKRSKDEKAEDEANEIEKNKRISQWLKIVGLDESILNRFPHELSGGQKQRVGIARALAASPKILLMDEPFGAVDEITRRQLQEEIKRIHRETGITIIFVTHDIGEALYLGDHVIVMDEGRINQYGKPEDILNNPATPFVEKLCERTKLVVNNKD
ncbi:MULTISPECIES: ABC transporter ATP-binding protein [Methanobrevibacter]|uniref:ATP-binding cassette domain-containing protein n=1 Tax=Methanobrevibacter TaxID=2172 RepID=UPI0003348E5C|nr:MULTISPECIES: ABC transporter ATP-binding protein [Methanobrevibacter]AGN16180.1 glycine betaine/L-proline ABC transporter ATP-binding protein [Methanobrevibacter sp. AbM4]MCI6774227.1 ABC transporter ATP-binding protein [Methanobrevibacter boviskoreani]MCI6930618.1 ABC transporter ATP-binding protein [Methanobrevibacter boviskoreani]